MQGNRAGLDSQLYDSIKKRQETNLLDEVEDLMKETSTVMEQQDKRNKEMATSGADGVTERSESPALTDLRKIMDLLAQKEADLELAAKIGDALFQENTRLRQETQGSEVMSSQLEAKDEEIAGLKGECKSLSRKVNLLTEHLAELDATNQKLVEQLQSEESTKARGDSHDSASVKMKRHDSVEHRAEQMATELEVTQASLGSWKKRATEAETEKFQLESNVSELRTVITKLEEKLGDEQSRIEQYRITQQGQKASGENESCLRSRIAELEKQASDLKRENDVLADDLREHKELLEEVNEQAKELADDRTSLTGDTLQSELADLSRNSSPSGSPSRAREEVDPYFFHFHMTAMSVKAHLSSQRDGNRTMISSAALDTINTMDTKEMYKDVLEKAIAPHHWIGYITDCFASAHLKSLLQSKKGEINIRRRDGSIQTTRRMVH
mmetsp:Transcript_19035/g.41290  ORF Transcript_19035/g.41290 Transcript_19035/m.41290 type:complete len:441 (-) Transcript_19035:476-1798(-)